MMCEKQGKSWLKFRSQLLQLGSIFHTYLQACTYLPYQSKILYSPNTLMWHTYCAITLILEELTGFLAVLFPLSNLTLTELLLLITVDLRVLGCLVFLIEAISMIRLHNLLKWLPWRVLVMKSATISLVGHHSISTSFMLTLSVMKKYRMLMCHVHLRLDALPFFSNSMELLLSCNKRFWVTPYPWATRK